MSSFASTFREILRPALLQHCRVAGFRVERGRWTFTQAHTFVFDFARSRGASHLPLPALSDLDQWIDSQILLASIEFEAPDKRREMVDELVAEAMAA